MGLRPAGYFLSEQLLAIITRMAAVASAPGVAVNLLESVP